MQTKSTLDGVLKSPENEIEELQITLEDAKRTVALRDDLMKLAKNKLFKSIIVDAYMKDEALRLTQIIGEIQHVEYRDEIVDALKGISHFRQWMDRILGMGDVAEQSIKEYENVLQDAYAEMEE
jgi:hypothetical protein